MDINDLRQENSRKIAEKVLEGLKEGEDSGANVTEEFIFCFETDDGVFRTKAIAPPIMLIKNMSTSLEVLQEEVPAVVCLAEAALKRMFSQKNSAD